MMFKKRRFDHPRYGTFEYRHKIWCCEHKHRSHGDILLCVNGDKTQPDHRAIEFLEPLLGQLSDITDSALSFVDMDEVREFSDGNTDLYLEELRPGRILGEYSVSFAFKGWDDGCISVSFKNSKPVEVLIFD